MKKSRGRQQKDDPCSVVVSTAMTKVQADLLYAEARRQRKSVSSLVKSLIFSSIIKTQQSV